MQWLLQRNYKETDKLGAVLSEKGSTYSFERMAPFVGDIIPDPAVQDIQSVIIFGLYSTRHYSRKRGFHPGIFELEPFVHVRQWQEHLLNSADAAIFTTVADIVDRLTGDPRETIFVRPVEDTKAIAGQVMTLSQVADTVNKVLALDPKHLFPGTLEHHTELMVCSPTNIQTEWRLWIVNNRVVTYSLYKTGEAVIYLPEVDPEVIQFADMLIALNPAYAQAYVMDICRTDDGLKLLETNCINSAGFYAADLSKLVDAIESGQF